jgi:hypothetical protein
MKIGTTIVLLVEFFGTIGVMWLVKYFWDRYWTKAKAEEAEILSRVKAFKKYLALDKEFWWLAENKFCSRSILNFAIAIFFNNDFFLDKNGHPMIPKKRFKKKLSKAFTELGIKEDSVLAEMDVLMIQRIKESFSCTDLRLAVLSKMEEALLEYGCDKKEVNDLASQARENRKKFLLDYLTRRVEDKKRELIVITNETFLDDLPVEKKKEILSPLGLAGFVKEKISV